MKKKVIIESHIPEVPQWLSEEFEVVRLDPELITPGSVAGADALVVRTRTKCDASLLEGSGVEFVATATIGTDHIDLGYCRSHGIEVASAPGCNAPAVAQYVLASLLRVFPGGLRGLTVGVVGVGHVGSIVAEWSRQLGMAVLECDPPRAEAEGRGTFVPIDEIARRADIVTFHVPHTRTGAFATHHLADGQFFKRVARHPVIVNSARGPVVDNAALVRAIDMGDVSAAVIDCWEGEPQISPELLARAVVATPHIAGYSLNGKIRATAMSVNALCRHFGIDRRMETDVPAGAAMSVTAESITASYDPMADTKALKTDPSAFEMLRNNYCLRPEVPEAIG